MERKEETGLGWWITMTCIKRKWWKKETDYDEFCNDEGNFDENDNNLDGDDKGKFNVVILMIVTAGNHCISVTIMTIVSVWL